jgi:HKD family nuclease
MRLLSQPFGVTTAGAEISRRLDVFPTPNSAVRIAVAYARASGVLRLAPALKRYRDRGGHVEVIVGVGRDSVTSRQALEILLDYSDVLYAFSNAATTFHPKIYLFRQGRQRAVAYVGSNNFTAGGLFTNYEACVELELDLTEPPHRQMYRTIASVIQRAKKATGLVQLIDAGTRIETLAQQGLLQDETRMARRARPPAGRDREDHHGGIAPPPPPPIDPTLLHRVPVVRREDVVVPPAERDRLSEGLPSDVGAGENPAIFVMQLDNRDTRQRAGYSAEAYIPIAARDANPDFWGWNEDYVPSAAGHPEKRVNVLVRPAGGRMHVAENKRLWYYGARTEFRFNNRELIAGSAAGDLLVIFRSPGERSGVRYEYEAVVVPPDHPAYEGYRAACVNEASPMKCWGYL